MAYSRFATTTPKKRYSDSIKIEALQAGAVLGILFSPYVMDT
jgi:hypothetical protein